MSNLLVHHLDNSRSHRIVWLLEEMDVPYDVRFHRRQPDMSAPPELAASHPLGKAPVLVDGDRSFVESGAIIEHLADRPDGAWLRPAAGPDLERYRFWLHFAEGSLMPPLLVWLYLSRLGSVSVEVTDRVDRQLGMLLNFCESSLAETGWFAGSSFSAADIQMSFPLEAAQVRAGLDERFPHLYAFLGQIRERPAYVAARERERLAEQEG